MLKRNIILLIIFLMIQDKLFADLIESTYVGPGVIHHHEFKEAGPWHINILEIDLNDEWIKLETVKAKNLLSGYEKTSSMATGYSPPKHAVQ